MAGFRMAAIVCSGALLFGQAPGPKAQLAFAPGGRITLDLEAGDYEIVPGAGEGIVVTWQTGGGREPRVRLQGSGAAAWVAVEDTPHQNFHARVEVPARSDLRVRLTAGDLTVGAIEGNKDLAIHAGDLKVTVPAPERYGEVHASVWAGDIHASAFGGEKGGLFRGFDWKGTGAYRLRAALWAGDITLARP